MLKRLAKIKKVRTNKGKKVLRLLVLKKVIPKERVTKLRKLAQKETLKARVTTLRKLAHKVRLKEREKKVSLIKIAWTKTPRLEPNKTLMLRRCFSRLMETKTCKLRSMSSFPACLSQQVAKKR